MKTLTAFKKLSLLVLVAVFTLSCSSDDDATTPVVVTPGPESITEIAEASDGLTSLVAALQRANLAETLDGPGPFTVFAPSNDAFATFLADYEFARLEDVPVEVLTQVLLNHVISGEATSGSLSTGYGKTLATETTSGENLSIFIDTNGGVTLNGISSVTEADIDASNGVIHLVDAVIGLPTVVDFALADSSTFSILVEALTRNDLTTDYVSVLSTANGTDPAPFTVFAPTNDAFAALLVELGFSGLGDIDEPTLNTVLSYHAVAGANVLAGDLMDDMAVPTLGGDITASVTGGPVLTDGNGRRINIIVTNVQAANGVIHAIDRVIMPDLGLPINIVETAYTVPALSNLLAALGAADGDLGNVLSGTGPFTVLAPTDDAFATFLDGAALGDVPTDVLAQVLLNHVITGTVMSTDLVDAGAGYASTNAIGAGGNAMSIYFNTSDGVTFNGISSVAIPDVETSNGVVHVVDAVIGLPTVVDFVLADPDFETLKLALTRDDLTTDYVSILSTADGTDPAPFTVFAPNNDAFGDLLTELTFGGLGDIPEAILNATLSMHAVAGANVRSSDLTDDMTVATLGGNITANITGGATLTDANDRISNIIAVDVQASNGVIHVIDKVVLPPL